jgi:predicted DNA-binding antitoxin AbrB/MazE fold protein
MQAYEGIYENGVVRFPGPVDIPEGAKVTVVAIDASPAQPPLGSNSPELYALLDQRFNSGQHDIAARYNEHQP